MTAPYTKQDADPACMTMTAGECLDPESLPWGDASFVWGEELERVNKILCRLTVHGSAL